jgi:hypothetical protein
MTATLIVPDPDEGTSQTVNINGSWTLSGRTITFSHDTDAFLREMPFIVDDKTLTGDSELGGKRLQVTFTKRTTDSPK